MRRAGLAQSRSKCRSPRDALGLPSWGHRAGGQERSTGRRLGQDLQTQRGARDHSGWGHNSWTPLHKDSASQRASAQLSSSQTRQTQQRRPPPAPQESSCKGHDWRAPNLRTGSLGIWHCPSPQPIPVDCSSLPEGGPAATSPPGRRWPRGSPWHLPASISLAHGSPLPSNPQLPWAHAPLGSGVRQLGSPGAI